MNKSAIALGGNVGNTAELFSAALDLLKASGVSVRTVSRNFRTAPMGSNAGNEFLNAVAMVETTLSARELLELLHQIETKLGRRRTVHWGPRTIDLDLLSFGEDVIATEQIVVPHPCLWHRRFVVKPLCEIDADWLHPVLHETAGQLFARLQQRPLLFELELPGAEGCHVNDVARRVSNNFGGELIELTSAGNSDENASPCFARIVVSKGSRAGQREHNGNRNIALNVESLDANTIATGVEELASAALG